MPRVLSIAWERISKIKYVFTEPEEIPELMCKLLEDVKNIRVELAEYIKKFPDAVTTVLPTEEPEYSLSIGYEHLRTTPETKLDEVTESSAKNLVPIPSEYEVTSDDESECDVPIKDDSSPVFTTLSNPLFDDYDDFTSSDDESLPDEDVPTKEFKVYSNPLFDDEEINSDKLDPHCFNAESDLIESLLNRYTLIDSSPKFSGELAHINPILPGIKEANFDLEEEIHFVENLLYDNSSPRPPEELNAKIANKVVESLSPSPIPDDPLFPCPHPEPPDVEFCFNLEPDSEDLISTVMKNIDELNEDECFDPGREIDVFANIEDDDYFPLPYLIYPEVSPFLLSAKSEDTIFDPGISV
nr:hypothetical protein [Tanacetum cinerariifolium]